MTKEEGQEVLRMMRLKGVTVYSLKNVFKKENGKFYSLSALYVFLKGELVSKRLEDCFKILYKKLFHMPTVEVLNTDDFE